MKHLLRNRNGTTKTITLLVIMLFLFVGLTLVTLVETDGFRVISGAAPGLGGKQLARAAKAVANPVAAGQNVVAQQGVGCTPACNNNQVCRNSQCVAVRLIAHYDFSNAMTDASGGGNDGTIRNNVAMLAGRATTPQEIHVGDDDGRRRALFLPGTNIDIAFRNPLQNVPRDEVTVMFRAKGSPANHFQTAFSYATGQSLQESSISSFSFLPEARVGGVGMTYQRAQLYLKPNPLIFHIPQFDLAWHHYAVTWRSSSGAVSVFVDGVVLPETALGEVGLAGSDRCFDRLDNDRDQKIDCADIDCKDKRSRRLLTVIREDANHREHQSQFTPACGVESDAVLKEYTCVDGIDNDGDGKTDCDDDSCFSREAEGRDKSICRRIGKFPLGTPRPALGSRLPGTLCSAGECDRTAAGDQLMCIAGVCVLQTITTQQGPAPADVEPAPSFTLGTGATLSPDGALMLGHDQTSRFAGFTADSAFRGHLDDVRIYDKALPVDTIRSILTAELTDICNPPQPGGCPATSFCLEPFPGVCQPKRENGQSCTGDVQCQSNICVGSLCAAARGPAPAPAPAPAQCVDADVAQGAVQAQSLVKSSVTLGLERQNDDCSANAAKAATVVTEKVCVNNQIQSVDVNCADQNKVCREGACVQQQAQPQEGRACVNNAECGAGLRCLARVCQTRVCSETDGGNDPRVAGVLTLDNSFTGDIVVEDTCENEEIILEYFCTPDSESSRTTVACPQGLVCQTNADGADACVAGGGNGGDAGGQQHEEAGEDEAGTSPWFARRSDEDLFMRK